MRKKEKKGRGKEEEGRKRGEGWVGVGPGRTPHFGTNP